METTLPKAYDPREFEERIYGLWKNNGYFTPSGKASGDPFVIVIPPPNVTGVLHMGHGLNISLQDILIRYWRMKNRPTLWVPGTDHAGIATQNVVEQQLAKKGLSRGDLGRERFVEETWKLKKEHHSIISKQLEKIGASCDWERERFTLDKGLSRAVRHVFVSLYERNLIYRGEYLVNWCSSCGTALSDDEVEHKETQGHLWHIRYPLSHGEGHLCVATTRPETMFGDSAVAVHPEDDRYRHMVGKTVHLPLTDREIPIIAEPYVDKEFGTGALKVTPAHDINDFEIGNRQGLERVNILNPDGTLNDRVPEFLRGLKIREARERSAEALADSGFLVDKKPHTHQVGHCYRCFNVVEPYISEQWFVRMAPLADKALEAWRCGDVRFHPKKWENTYRHWLENIRDWCISRQLWWGHRIPAWTCRDCGQMQVLREDPELCPACGSSALQQDPDVLDTWFSSWLWPFSVMGWPEKTKDFDTFYPTTALVTGYDIIFFWVARMIMAGLEFTDRTPFRDVCLTGLMRDKKGRKMAKSLNNGIDPLDVVEIHGADAMKFTLAYLSSQGEDLSLGMEDFKLGSKFANKIWNAARFILMNLEDRDPGKVSGTKTSPIDRWILHNLNETVKSVEEALTAYRFDTAAHEVYRFFWNDFCDWYLEAVKLNLRREDDAEKLHGKAMLLHVLEHALRLMHPFLPFITEEIWSKLPGRREALIVSAYPEYDLSLKDSAAESSFKTLQGLVTRVRTVRSEFAIPPGMDVKLRIEAHDSVQEFLSDNLPLIASLSGSRDSAFLEHGEDVKGSLSTMGRYFTVHMYIKALIDVDKAIARFHKFLNKMKKMVEVKERKLSNENFLSRAPENVVVWERTSLAELKNAVTRMSDYLTALED